MTVHNSAPISLVPAARVTRGNGVEAVHCAAIAVVDGSGALTHWLGDPSAVFFARSSLKPLQALPLVERGGLSRFGFDERELALCAASHSGTDRHRDLVAGMLAKLGLGEDALQCGPGAPLDAVPHTPSRSPAEPEVLRHNCSGKHCGFLALAKLMQEPTDRYLAPESATQRLVRAKIAELCDVEAERMPHGIDGCSAPNYALPLVQLARAFAKLAVAADESPLGKVRRAMLAHPLLVSGERRLDYGLATAFPGRLIAKGGAEGLQVLAFTEPAMAIAVKVIDGNARALGPIVVETLIRLGRIEHMGRFPGLDSYRRVAVHNARGLVTGFVEAELELETP